MEKHLYVIWAEDTKYFKLGISRTPEKRVAELAVGCPFPLILVGYREGTREQEKLLHKEMDEFRMKGEWFMLPELAVWHLLRFVGRDVPDEKLRQSSTP